MDVQRRSKPWNDRLLCLLFLVAECLRLGIAYTPLGGAPETLPNGLTIITNPLPGPTDNWNPIWLYGGAWLLNALVALFAFRRPRLHNAVYIAATVGMAWWSAAYWIAQFTTDDKRAWFTASAYIIFAYITAISGHRTRPQRPKATS